MSEEKEKTSIWTIVFMVLAVALLAFLIVRQINMDSNVSKNSKSITTCQDNFNRLYNITKVWEGYGSCTKDCLSHAYKLNQTYVNTSCIQNCINLTSEESNKLMEN